MLALLFNRGSDPFWGSEPFFIFQFFFKISGIAFVNHFVLT